MTSVVTSQSAESRLRVLAWTPVPHRALVPATAVWCATSRTFIAGNLFGYLGVLADRIQVLVEESDDPERAAHYFHSAMITNGIARRSGPIPVEYVGLRLVQANQAIAARLMQWGVHRALRRCVLVECLPARQALLNDCFDPEEALQVWAWRMGEGARTVHAHLSSPHRGVSGQ